MIHCSSMDNLVRDVYDKTFIQEIDTEHLRQYLSTMTYQNAIISLQGNDLLSQVGSKFNETPLSEVQKEPYFSAKFRFVEKPMNLREAFSGDEFDTMIA